MTTFPTYKRKSFRIFTGMYLPASLLLLVVVGVVVDETHGFPVTVPLSQPSSTSYILNTQQRSVFQVHAAVSDTIDATLESPVEYGVSTSNSSSIVKRLKQELIDLGQRTERGFKATRQDRTNAVNLIFDLAQYNPIREPVQSYYGMKTSSNTIKSTNNSTESVEIVQEPTTIKGKWTLIYTDAPDITSLGTPSPLVTLGRIGQDCTNPPYITNVIEWCSPEWMNNIPVASLFVGKNSKNDQQRVLQKVVTYGSAVPSSPTVVDLNVAGIQVATSPSSVSNDINDEERNVRDYIEEDGIIVGLLKQQQRRQQKNKEKSIGGTNGNNLNILQLDESQQPPFGSFEVLYLDDTFRITKTNRNHYAVNVRIIAGQDDEWF